MQEISPITNKAGLYGRTTVASNMLIWTKFMTPYQNFVIPLKVKTSNGHAIALWKKRCGIDQKRLII